MSGFQCATCGQFHEEIPMCLGAMAPALWESIPESERHARGELTSDLCVIDEKHFFILGRLIIPVADSPEPFVWLTWVSLSEKSFRRVLELWETEGRESEPPYFGWVQSALPYPEPTLSLKSQVVTQPVGQRPLIQLEPTSHPLSIEQREGITMKRVHQIVEGALHAA